MNKKYVLFDWDNTVRKGYTLYSWVDYLCSCHTIDSCIQLDLNTMRKEYDSHLITHDEYAQKACQLYSSNLKGIPCSKIDSLINNYIILDEHYIYNDIKKLFHFFFLYGFDIIIISGAPTIIIEKYKEKYNFKEIYAFKEKTLHDYFTGEVEYNYGFGKEKIVSELIRKYNSRPYMAFGDSKSDLPLLKYAYHSFYLGSEPVNKRYKTVTPDNIFYSVKRIFAMNTILNRTYSHRFHNSSHNSAKLKDIT